MWRGRSYVQEDQKWLTQAQLLHLCDGSLVAPLARVFSGPDGLHLPMYQLVNVFDRSNSVDSVGTRRKLSFEVKEPDVGFMDVLVVI